MPTPGQASTVLGGGTILDPFVLAEDELEEAPDHPWTDASDGEDEIPRPVLSPLHNSSVGLNARRRDAWLNALCLQAAAPRVQSIHSAPLGEQILESDTPGVQAGATSRSRSLPTPIISTLMPVPPKTPKSSLGIASALHPSPIYHGAAAHNGVNEMPTSREGNRSKASTRFQQDRALPNDVTTRNKEAHSAKSQQEAMPCLREDMIPPGSHGDKNRTKKDNGEDHEMEKDRDEDYEMEEDRDEDHEMGEDEDEDEDEDDASEEEESVEDLSEEKECVENLSEEDLSEEEESTEDENPSCIRQTSPEFYKKKEALITKVETRGCEDTAAADARSISGRILKQDNDTNNPSGQHPISDCKRPRDTQNAPVDYLIFQEDGKVKLTGTLDCKFSDPQIWNYVEPPDLKTAMFMNPRIHEKKLCLVSDRSSNQKKHLTSDYKLAKFLQPDVQEFFKETQKLVNRYNMCIPCFESKLGNEAFLKFTVQRMLDDKGWGARIWGIDKQHYLRTLHNGKKLVWDIEEKSDSQLIATRVQHWIVSRIYNMMLWRKQPLRYEECLSKQACTPVESLKGENVQEVLEQECYRSASEDMKVFR